MLVPSDQDIRANRSLKAKDRVRLRFGPYRTPRFRYGDVVFCERCGEVAVCGLSAARIPWPTCRRGKGRAIILCADLVDAVRRESSIAVQYWWGVGRETVWRWRKALGVEARTAGTRAIMIAYAKEPRMTAWPRFAAFKTPYRFQFQSNLDGQVASRESRLLAQVPQPRTSVAGNLPAGQPGGRAASILS
jgi:hypothetical protein